RRHLWSLADKRETGRSRPCESHCAPVQRNGAPRAAMPDKYLTSFIDELPRMDNDSLLRTLVRFNAAPGEYRPVAVAAARAEMERRGLAAAQLNEAARHAIQEVAESIVDDAVRLAEEGRTIA